MCACSAMRQLQASISGKAKNVPKDAYIGVVLSYGL